MKKFFTTLIIVCFYSTLLFSQSNFNINKKLIDNAGDSNKYPNSDFVVIYDSTDVDVMDSGLSYVFIHKLTKVLTSEGALNNRMVVFGYDPLSAAIEIKHARIYRKDGRVETISAERIYDYPAPARAIYWGAREKAIEFGRLEPGDAIETLIFRKGFTYALLQDGESDDERFVPPMRGQFYDIVEFWSAVPMLEKVYRVALPKEKKLQYEFYNGEASSYIHFAPENLKKEIVHVNPYGTQSKEVGDVYPPHGFMRPGKNIYCWIKKDIMPLKREHNMVSPSDVAPKLLLSTADDWYAKAVWFHKVNEDFGSFSVTPSVQKMTDKLLDGVTDEMEKISILTHWSAENIRYSGISMGEGEGYTLHTGQMTFTDRCGVCKDKAGMLITMLRAAGFESYPAMTMAGSRIDRIPADQFNHSVTVAKLSNGEWILLDPTWVPGVRELWSSAEQQQQYLMGIPGGSDLMTTPISPPENHYWKLKGFSNLRGDGTLEGTLTLTAEGQSDALIRRAFTRSYLSGWKEVVSNEVMKHFPTIQIIKCDFTNPYDINEPIIISVEYKIPNYAIVTSEKIIFTPLLAFNPFRNYYFSNEIFTDDTYEERDYGFRIRCSKLVEIEETVTLPGYDEAEDIPVFETVDGKSASFDAAYSIDNRTLKFQLTHRMEKRLYEKEDWPDFRSALKERKNAMNTPIILSK